MNRPILATLATLLWMTVSAYADLATITVDITKKSVSPDNPTVNIAANDAVLLRIVIDGKELPSGATVSTTLAGPRPLIEIADRRYAYAKDTPAGDGSSPLLVLRQCDDAARKDFPIVSAASIIEPPRCPVYTIDNTRHTFTVVIYEGIVLVSIAAQWRVGEQYVVEEYAFALQVVDRKYALTYSAGFSFLGVRDHEYRLEPITGNDKELSIVRNGSGSVPYQLAAFTHYTRLSRRTRSIAASFGVATKVPVNELTAMLGATLSLRTLPLVNTGHLTVGLAYAPRKELISDYRARFTVPAGTSAESLTSSRYGFGVFVGVTFSFFGGEEQFKGVYSGKSSDQK